MQGTVKFSDTTRPPSAKDSGQKRTSTSESGVLVYSYGRTCTGGSSADGQRTRSPWPLELSMRNITFVKIRQVEETKPPPRVKSNCFALISCRLKSTHVLVWLASGFRTFRFASRTISRTGFFEMPVG